VLIPMTPLSGDADLAAASDDDDELGLDAPSERTRVTLCVSTQFGCAMGCVFCASGRAGLGRGLGADEIVSQVIIARRYLDASEDLTNLVFMGMGEPLHHYDETARALRLLTHPEGTGMSPRRITVSTVGLVPGLKKLGADFAGKVGLAVSLHAPDDPTRDRIVPMNKRYPLSELIAALKSYPLPRRRRITIEYTLIDGVNDSDAHADRLVRVLSGLAVKVNLIPMNPVEGSGLQASPPERVDAFQARVAGYGYSCFVRARRGDEVSAACGQLALAPGLIELGRNRAPL
jgi:23S rRNA (adenine2503-C2)-methyltransferase